nr:beta-galactosidase 10 [Tanacetum cinerariifolium]
MQEVGHTKKYRIVLLRYHVPRSWFKPSGNVLVLFEEKGRDPTQITFSRRKLSALCAHSYTVGECHDPNSTSIVEKLCLGKNECIVELTNEIFNMELCSGLTKKLAVEATCS